MLIACHSYLNLDEEVSVATSSQVTIPRVSVGGGYTECEYQKGGIRARQHVLYQRVVLEDSKENILFCLLFIVFQFVLNLLGDIDY